MAFLHELVRWEDGIYQLEVTDYVLGGSEGVTNLPLKQLANRTASLRKNITDLTEDVASYKIVVNKDLTGIHASIDSLKTITTTHTGNISTLDTRVTEIDTYIAQTATPHIVSHQNPHQTTAEQIGAVPILDVSTTAEANMIVRRDANGTVVGDITGNAITLEGRRVSTTSTPETVAVRDVDGIVTGNSFKVTREIENSLAADAFIFDSGNGILRKKSVSDARAEILSGVNLGNKVAAISGVAYHGTALPLPAGYTVQQCFWVVGTGQFADFGGISQDGNDTFYCFVNADLIINCYVTNALKKYYGYANYLVIGIK